MNNQADWDDYELPQEYDFTGKEAVRGRFYSPKKKSVTIRLDDGETIRFSYRSRTASTSPRHTASRLV